MLNQLHDDLQHLSSSFLDAKSLVKLSVCSRFHAEKNHYDYWAPKLIQKGCKKELVEKLAEIPGINFAKLYRRVSKLASFIKELSMPWELICMSGSEDAIAHAIKTGMMTATTQNVFDMNPLHFAALGGNRAAFLKVKSLGIKTNVEDDVKMTPFHYAGLSGNTETIDEVLKSIVEEVTKSIKDSKPNTDKIIASIKDSKTNAGDSIIHYSATFNDDKAIRHLVTHHKISADTKNEAGQTPLHWAGRNGNLKVIRYLINECKQELRQMDRGGNGFLHHLFACNNVESIQTYCKEFKIDPKTLLETKNKLGQNLLHTAVKGCIAVVDYAIKTCGFDAKSTDDSGFNALHFAAIDGSVSMMKHLVQTYGLDPAVRTKANTTLLQLAAYSGNPEAVLYVRGLLTQLDLNARNNEGHDTYWFADASGNKEKIREALTQEISAQSAFKPSAP